MTATELPGHVDLSEHGIDASGSPVSKPDDLAPLHARARRAATGGWPRAAPLVVDTGRFTGRSPKDKFLVRGAGLAGADLVGRGQPAALARSISPGCATRSRRSSARRMRCTWSMPGPGADPAHRIGVRVVTAHPYHALFAKTMFIDLRRGRARRLRAGGARAARAGRRGRPGRGRHAHGHVRRAAPGPHRAARRRDVLRRRDQEVDLHRDERPAAARGRLPDALLGERRRDGDVAVFFGLSGTGKTTLSADPERSLIGDDEHGWGDSGVFNIEGGCYAKTIRLSPDGRAGDLRTTRTRSGRSSRTSRSTRTASSTSTTTRRPRTRAPRTSSSRSRTRCRRSGPGIRRRSIFLTADAFGILPPIARLSREQALYYFLSGFTAKLAGHRDRRDRAAADVLDLLRAAVPAAAAGSSMRGCSARSSTSTASRVWLVNTGWTGGPFGEGRAHADRTRPARCSTPRSRGEPRRRRVPHRRALRLPGAGPTSPASTRSSSIRARPGAIPDAYDAQGARARRACSPTTSPRASATSTTSIRAAGPTLSLG